MSRATSGTDSVVGISLGQHVSAAGAVSGARVRLTWHADPAVEKPIVAQANVDMDGRSMRVQVKAAATQEAVDLLEARVHGARQDGHRGNATYGCHPRRADYAARRRG